MKVFLIFYSFLLSCFALAIVGGHPVASSDPSIKWTVSWSYKYQSYCSGVLIDPFFVLTAAHCVFGGKDEIGFGPIISKEKATFIAVERVYVHPGFQPDLMPNRYPQSPVNDLAILKLKHSAPVGFVPIALTPLNLYFETGETISLAGFGRTTIHDGPMGILHQVETLFDHYHLSSHEFIFGPTPGKSACGGDSGGPAFFHWEGKTYLMGITSRSGDQNQHSTCDGSGVYTDLRFYTDWIDSIVRRN